MDYKEFRLKGQDRVFWYGGKVTELVCDPKPAAVIQANGSWFVFVDENLIEVDGKPYNLQ